MKHRTKLERNERIQPEEFLNSVRRLMESFGKPKVRMTRTNQESHPTIHVENLTRWLAKNNGSSSLGQNKLAENGMNNLETWTTYEWLKNDDYQDRYWRLQAEETWEKLGEEVDGNSRPELANYILADLMREKLVPEFIPGCDFIQLLFRSAYDEVNWLELASLFLEELDSYLE